jgi:hypothetical protein
LKQRSNHRQSQLEKALYCKLLASLGSSAPQRLQLVLPSFISFVLARFIFFPSQRQLLASQLASQL